MSVVGVCLFVFLLVIWVFLLIGIPRLHSGILLLYILFEL